MAEGSLLSLNGERKLSILSRDLKHVRYRAQRVFPKQIPDFITQSYGSLEDPQFYSNFGMENISETFSEVRALPFFKHGKTQYSHFDFTGFLNKVSRKPRGLFKFTAEGWNEYSQRREGPVDQRFILLTDIGIISKKSVDGGYDLFIQSISSGQPIPEARVQVIGKNGLPVLTQISDDGGTCFGLLT